MIVGFNAAHTADACQLHRLHGQRVFGVVDCAMLDGQRVREIGHPLNGPVQGTLEQSAVDRIPVGNLHRVDGNIYRQIDIGGTGNGQFLFFEIGTS